MKRKAVAEPKYDGPVHPYGTKVRVVRPNPVWVGEKGEVISVNNGRHRVRITREHNGHLVIFHIDAPWNQLEVETK